MNEVNAIVSVVLERNITDLVVERNNFETAQFSRSLHDIVYGTNVTTFIYRSAQHFATIKRHIVVVPKRAELEAGFNTWVLRVRHLAHDTKSRLLLYATEPTLQQLQKKRRKVDIATYSAYPAEENLERQISNILQEIKSDDCLWVVMSRKDGVSYQTCMSRVPAFMERSLPQSSYVLLFPVQAAEDGDSRYI